MLKFGALGDLVQAFAAFAQIRAAHSGAEITLLTTPAYVEFARASRLFDLVEADGRPQGLAAHWALFQRLRRRRYDRVYDLQTSSRSKTYFYAFWPRPPAWSGISPGASHRQTRPDRTRLHNLDRIADQMAVAGVAPHTPIGAAPVPDLSWAVRLAKADRATTAERFGISPLFALLVPGASPVKPEKFWPVEAYAALAVALQARGLQVVVIGSPQEAALAGVIRQACPTAADLTGATSLVDLAGLASEAALCVGNDTGPTHLIAYAGAPGLMLMSRVSDPAHCGPRAKMTTLRVDDLAALSPEAVLHDLFVSQRLHLPSAIIRS